LDTDVVALDAHARGAPRSTAAGGQEAGTPRETPLSEVASAPRRRNVARPTREALETLLRGHQGSVRAVAGDLDVARRTVYRWMDALGIPRDAYRG
jgi:transcriptional regulator of acetoin/glycerol metabolism